MTSVQAPPTQERPGRSPFAQLRRSFDVLYREVAKFGAVGAIAFVVDTGMFNLLLHTAVGQAAGLGGKPLTAKTISVVVATVVAWLGNRYWTFRHRRRASLRREFVLFFVMNAAGLAISLACLGFSRYVLKLESPLADNISGNVIGLGLGTLFRFWAYRTFVFAHDDDLGTDDLTPPGTPEAIARDLAQEHEHTGHEHTGREHTGREHTGHERTGHEHTAVALSETGSYQRPLPHQPWDVELARQESRSTS